VVVRSLPLLSNDWDDTPAPAAPVRQFGWGGPDAATLTSEPQPQPSRGTLKPVHMRARDNNLGTTERRVTTQRPRGSQYCAHTNAAASATTMATACVTAHHLKPWYPPPGTTHLKFHREVSRCRIRPGLKSHAHAAIRSVRVGADRHSRGMRIYKPHERPDVEVLVDGTWPPWVAWGIEAQDVPGRSSSTLGTYSTSWIWPSKVRLSAMSRATSGYPS
jgi:hypothetical protein